MKQPHPTNAQSKPTDSKPKNPCNGCGNTHWKKECPFKNAECHLCKKKGHIKEMCFKAQSQKSQSKSNVNFSSDGRSAPLSNPEFDLCYEFVYAVNGKKVNPILVTVILDKVSVVMELDTGAACTLMSKSMYERLWPVVSERPLLYSSCAKLSLWWI